MEIWVSKKSLEYGGVETVDVDFDLLKLETGEKGIKC